MFTLERRGEGRGEHRAEYKQRTVESPSSRLLINAANFFSKIFFNLFNLFLVLLFPQTIRHKNVFSFFKTVLISYERFLCECVCVS